MTLLRNFQTRLAPPMSMIFAYTLSLEYLKDNIKESAKIIDKYLFKVYQVDIDDEIRQYLYDLSIEQLDKVIKKTMKYLIMTL